MKSRKLNYLLEYEIKAGPVPNSRLAKKIAKYGSEAVEPLIEILNKDDFPASQTAAFTLGIMRDNRAVRPLIEALKRARHKIDYIDALWFLKAMEAKDILKEYLTTPGTAREAAFALYDLGEKELAVPYILESIKPFCSIFQKKNGRDERKAAIYICANLGIKEAVATIFDNIVDLKEYGVEALAVIGGQEVREKAMQMTASDDVHSLYANYCLGLLKDESLLPTFLDMLANSETYEKKYGIESPKSFLLVILGNYSNNTARLAFFKNVNQISLEWYVSDYYYYNDELNTYGWGARHKIRRDIVINQGWDRYLKNELYSKAVAAGAVPSEWDDEEDEALDRRKKMCDEVMGKIMEDIVLKIKDYEKKMADELNSGK